MIRDLERLVWRYSNASCSAGHVERALRSELHRLVDERAKLQVRTAELRSYSAETLRQFDHRIATGMRHLGALKFAEALKAMREAAAALEALQSIDGSLQRLETIQKEWNKLFEKLELAQFADLPTLKVLDILILWVQEFLKAGEERKTQFVILLLKREREALSAQERVHSQAKRDLSCWLNLTKIAASDPARLDKLQSLLDEGYVNLSERLCEDLEIQLGIPALADHPCILALEKTHDRAVSLAASIAEWAIGGLKPSSGEENNGREKSD